MPKQGGDFSARCISLDLEVSVKNGKIHAFAAVRPDTGQYLRYPQDFPRHNLMGALVSLDNFASGADFLLGHNLIAHDLPHLRGAKPDVVTEIVRHMQDKLKIEMKVFNGGAQRENLLFEVLPTTGGEKSSQVHQLITDCLGKQDAGGAIVYRAKRRDTEELVEFLGVNEVAADYFHAGLQPESKKDVQQRFIGGESRVIVATNAFGMGIDKQPVSAGYLWMNTRT